MSDKAPTIQPSLPRVQADFNEIGLSGESDDNCCYALYKDDLARISPAQGMKVFLWDDDGDGEIIGCVATLERHTTWAGDSWRARIDETTWYKGPKP